MGYRHRFAGGRCHCRCGERVQTLAGKPNETGGGTSADTGSRIQRFQRSAYAYPELHAHYRGELRSSVFLSGMEGRMFRFGHCLHRGIGSFYGLWHLTVTPVLCSYLLGKKIKTKKAFHRRFARSTQMKEWYGAALTLCWVIRRAYWVEPSVCLQWHRPASSHWDARSCRHSTKVRSQSTYHPAGHLTGRATRWDIGRRIATFHPEIQTVARKTGRAPNWMNMRA